MLVVLVMAVVVGLLGAFMWWYRPAKEDSQPLRGFIADHAIASVVAAVFVGVITILVAWLTA